ncbi:hypothetical protein JCM33374_g24 [Metschnikowia sp. JCM 33374]|nr:hypothetical protein JCM33374_g24 [Metschnikowia sp. JCM 33374]
MHTNTQRHPQLDSHTFVSQHYTNKHRTRKELNGSESDSSSTTSNGSHGFPEHTSSIPANKEGKRYTMKQAFNVWFDNKNGMLADVSVGVKTGENYKLSEPQQIYHLDLYHSNFGDDAPKLKDDGGDDGDGDGDGSGSGIGGGNGGGNGDFSADLNVKASPAEKSLPVHPILPPNLSKPSSFGHESAPETPTPALIQPENIAWVYLDPAGNEQGPFTGDIMQEWLTDGYLSLDLRIRRKEESRFQTLKDFCESVQNFIQPFKVPLPSVRAEPAQVPVAGSFHQHIPEHAVPGEATNGFGGGHGAFQNGGPSVPAPHQQSSFGSNLYSQLLPNGGLGAANIRTPSTNGLFDFMGPSDYPLMNPPYSAGNQFGIDSMNPNLSFNQLHMPSLLQQQISSQSPSLSRSNSGWGIDNSLQGSLPSTPTVASAPVPLGIGQASLGQSSLGQSGSMSPWINRVQNMSRVSSPFVPASTLATEHTEKAEDNLLQDIHSSMVSVPEPPVEETTSVPEKEVISETVTSGAPVHSQDPETKEAEPATFESKPVVESAPESKPEEPKPSSSSENTPRAAPSQPAVAPWAAVSKQVKQDAPPLTLKQIQELEAERLQREKQLKAEMKQEIALANALAASKLEEKIPEKVTFNWATSSQPVTAKKTLAEIQREEEAEAAKLKASKSVTTTGAKISLASTLASTPVKEDFGGAWTTVTSKKPTLKKQVSTPASTGISYSTVNTQAIKEDFLVWARSAMTNLYPSVSKNDLLEVFTTLPLHGESAQLISETIYSSSATMDGRRFSQEFMKRRQQVEKQVGPSAPESWSSAIISSADKVPTVDDDGWSTSVKSKKKGRKNQN